MRLSAGARWALVFGLLLAAVQVQGVSICFPGLTAAGVDACTKALLPYLADAVCVPAATSDACMQLIVKGDADLVRLGGDDLFRSNRIYNLQPYVFESYNDEDGVEYYGVAVVRKEFCEGHEDDETSGFKALKGTAACSTGYRKTSGWTLPLGYLVANKIAPVVSNMEDVNNDAETFSDFFSEGVCAPRKTADGPRTNGKLWQPLCINCKGDCSDTVAEPYQDYPGSLRCLVEGAGDVAFMKHTTPLDYSLGGKSAQAWSVDPEELRLVCPNKYCGTLDEWMDCQTGVAAAHAFVGRPGEDYVDFAQMMMDGGDDLLVAGKKIKPTPLTSSGAIRVGLVEEDFDSYFRAAPQFQAMRDMDTVTARFCTASPEEQAFCQQNFTRIANRLGLGVTFSCVMKNSTTDCLEAIRNGEADLRRVGSADIYRGFADYDLKAIAVEYNSASKSSATYFGVAIVNKDFCTANTTLASLKGKNSCHTGYGRTTGWQAPVGVLVAKGIMPIVRQNASISDEAESLAAFFGKTCAANVASGVNAGPVIVQKGNLTIGAKWDQLCSACAGDCSNNGTREPYWDYHGALRGLVEGSCDVAFTRHEMGLIHTADGSNASDWINGKTKDDFRLLCASGGCAPLNHYYKCNMARITLPAVMVRANWASTDRLKKALVAMAADSRIKALIFNATANPRSSLFANSASDIEPIDDDTRAFLGNSYDMYQGLDLLRQGTTEAVIQVNWCTASAEEQAFCNRVTSTVNPRLGGVHYYCVQRANASDCMTAIKNGQADIRAFSSQDMYTAHKQLGLQAIAAEYRGENNAPISYYGVAIVRQDICHEDTTLESLRGTRACSTGYRRNAGFQVPLGTLVSSGLMEPLNDDEGVANDAETWAGFFAEACAPGTRNGTDNGPLYNPNGVGEKWDLLCSACAGDCSATAREPLYDYPGSVRGLVEDRCDVSFTDWDVPFKYLADGTAPADWANDMTTKDFKLICSTGGCADLTEYKTCNLATLPTAGFMARPNWSVANRVRDSLVRLAEDTVFDSMVLNATANPRNFLMQTSATGVIAVQGSTKAFLGSGWSIYEGLAAVANQPLSGRRKSRASRKSLF